MFRFLWALFMLPIRLILLMFRMVFYPFRLVGNMLTAPKYWFR